MEFVIISIVAFATAILTFFSGFGLGTILTPVFAIFFPIDQAIALTGVVHFANNIFKLFLVGKSADLKTILRFGITAVIFAFIGANILLLISDLPPWYIYKIGDQEKVISPVKLVIVLLLISFSLMDLIPVLKKLKINSKWLPIGGALSGFFGGLSGHQGALRSAFLIKAGLNKEAFIGTGVVIGSFIDFTRLSVYAIRFKSSDLIDNLPIVITATIAAIAGAFIGNKILKKITLVFIQTFVAIALIIISIALGAGLI
ncbi:MAG: sulfite exporter TauE/SafE family protein [Bacteroidia bacterium]